MQPFINIDLGGPAQPLLKVNNLLKHFPAGGGKAREVVQAVDDVSFSVIKGETLGVVGESGCGKSTTARLLMQLLKQDSGELIFDGLEVGSSRLPMKAYRRQVQMVFQDSYASLNPRMTMEESIAFGTSGYTASAPKRPASTPAICWRTSALSRNVLPIVIRTRFPAVSASG